MAKPLYVYSVCAHVCVLVRGLWAHCDALILMSLSTSWPTWPSTGLFSTAGRYRRSAEGTARGFRTNSRTHTQMLALKHLRAWKHNSMCEVK